MGFKNNTKLNTILLTSSGHLCIASWTINHLGKSKCEHKNTDINITERYNGSDEQE